MIILLGITLKYSNLCTFSWFLVKLLLLIKTAQLTVRGLLDLVESTSTTIQPSRTAPRARFIPGSHDVAVDEGFPDLLPHLCLLETDQALTVAALLSCQATSSNLRGRHRKGRGSKEKGEGIRERGEGTSLSLSFSPFSPPPLPSPRLFCACRAIFKTSSKKLKCLKPYCKKKKKLREIFKYHLVRL